MFNNLKRNWKKYSGSLSGIFIPAIAALLLFFISLFVFIIPHSRNQLLEEKKRHVRELTQTSWGILYAYFYDELFGIIPKDSAQKRALTVLSKIRYGTENKDYFWIIDTTPKMIMHPYRKELIGKDVSDFQDVNGKKLFKEAVRLTHEKDEGYISYMWQWKDDSLVITEKISYVKLFRPWGWIIGTGIYLEDVKTETKKLIKNTLEISLIIFFLVLAMMIFLMRHAIRIETLRQNAEKERKITFEKYKALAEANPEGVIMIFDDNHLNLNKNMQRILGYREEDIPRLHIHDIISQQQIDTYLGEKYFRYLILGVAEPKQFEANFRKHDGSFVKMFVNCSRLIIDNKPAVVLSVKDTFFEEIARKNIGITGDKYMDLLNIVHIGLFSIKSFDEPEFIEVNAAFSEILGFRNKNDVFTRTLRDFFRNQSDWELIRHYFNLAGYVKKIQVTFSDIHNNELIVELSAKLLIDGENNITFIEGMIIDKSGEARQLSEKEFLLSNLKTSAYLLHQPLKNIAGKLVYCESETTVGQLIDIMKKNQTDAILVKGNEDFLGIITDHDLRDKVLAASLGKDVYAREIMTSPLISLPDTSLALEALQVMQEYRINHLPVTGDNHIITALLSVNDILQMQQNTASMLLFIIQNSNSPEDWINIRERLYALCKMYLTGGSHFQTIGDLITNISDAIAEKLCQWAESEFGPPPVSYSFFALGSQGRRELTLTTDQDNALVFENVEADQLEQVRNYFLKFSEYVCYGLDKAGYTICAGELMALNPKWCLSVQEWKSRYSAWILLPDNHDIIESTAFFDIRHVYGNSQLLLEIKNHISHEFQKSKKILQFLYDDLKKIPHPTNVFGKLRTEKTDRHPEAVNLKTYISHIVKLVRIIALSFQIDQVNTIERLKSIENMATTDKKIIEELQYSFNWLMLIRLRSQLSSIEKEYQPDNFIDIRYLSAIEQDTLKKIALKISKIHFKIRITD